MGCVVLNPAAYSSRHTLVLARLFEDLVDKAVFAVVGRK
jgi:hypothetical protein